VTFFKTEIMTRTSVRPTVKSVKPCNTVHVYRTYTDHAVLRAGPGAPTTSQD